MKIKLLHETDLYHPHGDPDDHYDLACLYSFAHKGDIEIAGILIDYPPPHRVGGPGVIPVAQMNYLTGSNVPVIIGTKRRMLSRQDTMQDADFIETNGVKQILKILEQSNDPVVITIVGACHDIAIAGKRNPKLFQKKCKAIYLNAGTGVPDFAKEPLEYNVKLNASAYAAIFDLPCPVYWMPCYHKVPIGSEEIKKGEFGSHYQFKQNEILPYLSNRMKNYFIYMLSRSKQEKWLRFLENEPDATLMDKFGKQIRNCWCTASFLHATGRVVTNQGNIVDIEKAGQDTVYTFEPIKITCSDEGFTQWSFDEKAKDRYLFRVKNIDVYYNAMTKALRTILSYLP